MAKKHLFFLLLLSILFIGCGRQKREYDDTVKIITVDTSTAEERLDISDRLDLDRVEIVKLDTRDDALVSLKGNIQIKGDHVFVGDPTSRRLALFDRQGRFIRNIGRVGRGPGEYIQLGSFVVMEDSVYVQDASRGKVVVYPVSGEGFREMTLTPPIYYVDLFSGDDDRLYFVTNYVSTGERSANLVGMDMKNGRRDYYIPFDPDIEENNQAWGLNKYTASDGNETLIVYARNDTIYRVSHDDVSAQYVMDFTQKRIPASLLRENGTNVLRNSLENGYNAGLDEIYNFSDYFFAGFSEGSTDIYTLIYDKRTGQASVGKSLVVGGLGDLQVLDFWTTEDDELVLGFDAYVLKTLWEYNLSKNEFVNATLKESMRDVVQASQDNENPILIVIKLK